MTTIQLCKARYSKHINTHALIKVLIYMFIIYGLIACTPELKPDAKKQVLSDEQHEALALKAKHAILQLDSALVEKLSANIDVNRLLPDKSSLLSWAVETQEPILVKLLLEKGALVHVENSNRFTPIIQACRYGNAKIIHALLDAGADPNSSVEDKTNAFQLCAGSTSTDVLIRMISQGANFDAKNDYGQTALMWSAHSANIENINYLVNIGANINHQTEEGYSPLFFAIKSQNLKAVKTIIAHGADLFAKAKDGTTATQLGVYANNYTFLNWYISELDLLMSHKAKQAVLSAHDRNGDQLLHAAVKANQPELVAQLLEFGANSKAVSEPSKLTWRYEANFKTEDYNPPQLTPIDIAKKLELETIISILSESPKN